MRTHHQRGIGLLELVIVIIIIGILAMATSPLMSIAMKTPQTVYNQQQLAAQGEYTLAKIVDDIESITGQNATALCSSLVSGNSSFSFITGAQQEITYSLNGSDLEQQLDDGSNGCITPTANSKAILSDNISNLTFTYLDQNLNLLTGTFTARQIYYVQVSFTYTVNSLSNTFSQIVFLQGSVT